MNIWVGLGVFACLSVASLSTMHFYPKLPPRLRDEDTNAVLRLVANFFVVVTSLVFGLMINSAKNTFESVDHNVHAYATDLILLDRMLRTYGPAGNDARQKLTDYVAEAIAHPARADDTLRNQLDTAGRQLDAVGDALAAILPSDRYHEHLIADARELYRRIVEQRWTIVEQSEGAIPMPLIGMLVAWLTLIFASLGYRAPPNTTVVTVFLVSALLIAASVYLVLDMNVPFAGPIQVSDAPLRRALAEIEL
jgi:hypothetical protein